MSVTPINISIHALREEGDRLQIYYKVYKTIFLSTPSARRATDYMGVPTKVAKDISIHALREEGDSG